MRLSYPDINNIHKERKRSKKKEMLLLFLTLKSGHFNFGKNRTF